MFVVSERESEAHAATSKIAASGTGWLPSDTHLARSYHSSKISLSTQLLNLRKQWSKDGLWHTERRQNNAKRLSASVLQIKGTRRPFLYSFYSPHSFFARNKRRSTYTKLWPPTPPTPQKGGNCCGIIYGTERPSNTARHGQRERVLRFSLTLSKGIWRHR